MVSLWWGCGDNEGQENLFGMEGEPIGMERKPAGPFCSNCQGGHGCRYTHNVLTCDQCVEEAGLVWEREHHITHIQM